MTRSRKLVGFACAAIIAVPLLVLATGETGTYTMTVDADISAGVLQTSSCTVVESKPAAGGTAPVITIRPIGRIWMFHSEQLGMARVHCGLLGRLSYTFEVLRPVRLEVTATDRAEVGQTIAFYAVAYDASGQRVSSDVKIDHWKVTGPLVQERGSSSCEFPPWCGGPGPASFRATATAEGPATVEATLDPDLRGKKTVTIIPKTDSTHDH